MKLLWLPAKSAVMADVASAAALGASGIALAVTRTRSALQTLIDEAGRRGLSTYGWVDSALGASQVRRLVEAYPAVDGWFVDGLFAESADSEADCENPSLESLSLLQTEVAFARLLPVIPWTPRDWATSGSRVKEVARTHEPAVHAPLDTPEDLAELAAGIAPRALSIHIWLVVQVPDTSGPAPFWEAASRAGMAGSLVIPDAML